MKAPLCFPDMQILHHNMFFTAFGLSRLVYFDLTVNKIKKGIVQCIEDGYTNFICCWICDGDYEFAKAFLEVRQRYPEKELNLIIYTPYPGHQHHYMESDADEIYAQADYTGTLYASKQVTSCLYRTCALALARISGRVIMGGHFDNEDAFSRSPIVKCCRSRRIPFYMFNRPQTDAEEARFDMDGGYFLNMTPYCIRLSYTGVRAGEKCVCASFWYGFDNLVRDLVCPVVDGVVRVREGMLKERPFDYNFGNISDACHGRRTAYSYDEAAGTYLSLPEAKQQAVDEELTRHLFAMLFLHYAADVLPAAHVLDYQDFWCRKFHFRKSIPELEPLCTVVQTYVQEKIKGRLHTDDTHKIIKKILDQTKGMAFEEIARYCGLLYDRIDEAIMGMRREDIFYTGLIGIIKAERIRQGLTSAECAGIIGATEEEYESIEAKDGWHVPTTSELAYLAYMLHRRLWDGQKGNRS